MLKIIQIIITLLIVASFILQILVILGNFNGLRSVNIARIELEDSASNGMLGDILDAAQGIAAGIPSFLTVALFVVCEGSSSNETVCSPPSFGYRYSNSTSTLQMIQGQIPEWLHRTVAGLQGGVFIPSVILCFILLCYNFYHQYTGHSVKHQFGWCRKIMISIVALIAMVLCIATFVVQIVAYNILKREINNAKGELLGGLIGSLVNVNTRTGASVWMSLAAAIALLFATVLLCFTVCCMDRRKTRAAKDEYPMDRI